MVPSNISDYEYFKYYVESLEISERGLKMCEYIAYLEDTIRELKDKLEYGDFE